MSDPKRPLVAELERRIDELEHHAEEAFGRFSTLDWCLCVLIGLAIPGALLVVSWP